MRFARPVQWTLALAFVSSLGFGATQALAAPQDAPVARACDWYTCHTACVNKGYFKGSCYNGVCSCSPRP